MGSYIGKKPSDVPLTSSDINDNIITSAKIVNGTIVDADINASAAIAESKLGVTSYDDNKLQSNIALLGFKTAVNGSLAKYNLQDQIIDEYTDATGIDASASTNEDLTAGVYQGLSGGAVLTATGGGGGGSRNSIVNYGRDGGSGGGAGQKDDGTNYKGDGLANQGNDGGDSTDAANMAGGGGGGASAAGATATSGAGGVGGAGYTEGSSTVYDWTLADGTTATFNIDGTSLAYAGGGGGAGKNSSAAGGSSIGGAGNSGTGGNATASRGSGGGGAGATGGNGSNGVVIFRYLTSAGTASGDADATGTSGSYNWAKFTTSGNFIISFATNVDIFVLAGGGAGGGGNSGSHGEGGGGGAGGFKYFSQKSLIAGTYPVVIGAGSTSGGVSTSQGGDGGDSTVSISGIVSNLTLQSTDTTASTANPDYADMVILMEDAAGTATLNTDIKGYISEDSGVTFTQGTLVDEGTWGTNKKIIAFHDLDISAQTGSAMCYKITTHNQSVSKNTKIHATSIGWK